MQIPLHLHNKSFQIIEKLCYECNPKQAYIRAMSWKKLFWKSLGY